VSEAPLTYAYALASEAESIDGSITYVDDEGNVLLTTPIEGIAKGTTRKVPVPSVITVGEGADASYWRTVCFGGAVEAGYPGTSDFTISCKSLGGPAGNAGGFYNATIRYVDGQGNVLWTQPLVGGMAQYPAAVGDIDGDGSVTISDVTAIQRYLAEMQSFYEEERMVADTNADGVIDISDATYLQMYLAGYDVVLA
jgi:hypothetical protein